MPKPKFYADLHCHPALYSFNRMRQTELENDPERFHLWQPQPENVTHLRQARRAGSYPQADPAKLTRGRCRLTFASITPIEKGFLLPGADISRPFSAEALKLATGTTLARSSIALFRKGRHAALAEITGILRNDGPLREAVQRLVLNYDVRRLRFLMSERYDYWLEFLREYDFYARRDGVESTAESPSAGRVTGTYELCTSLEQLEQLATHPDEDDVLMILSIEGAHTFTIGPDDQRRPDEAIFERIAHLKSMPSPIFFLTLAHHFDNGICGHAHSLPDVLMLLTDQRPRMHEGFEQEGDLGLAVVRALLSLDELLQDTGERRILIDCKHMSARSRQQYYRDIISPANALRKKKKQTPIPVIFSHAAYSGVRSLDAFIRDGHKEDDAWRLGPYYAWNLHCCDEDLLMILKSRGLFGLCFDQRVAGQPNAQQIHPEQLHHLLFQQILGVVDAIVTRDDLSEEEKITIWDRLCIGSDFDGLIDPVSAYPSALSFDAFAADLARDLEEVAHTRFIARVGVERIVEKICWENAHQFAMTHLPDALK